MPSIVVTGDRKLDRALRALGAKEANKVARRVLREQARSKVKPAIERNAPEAETRALARSVIVRAGKRSRKRISYQAGYDESRFKGETFYATFVEYGTSAQPAQGTMRRSFDETKGAVLRDALKGIRDGIEGAARRG